jgi:putative aldouronate transport system permease protein
MNRLQMFEMSLKERQKRERRVRFKKSKSMYALLFPAMVLLLLFHYLPMFGLVIAFKDYNIMLGSNPIEAISLSPWVGLKNWTRLWVQSKFQRSITNTLIISLMKILFYFPVPILLALMVNEVRHTMVKRTIQTVLYLPHFMSWVVVGALFMNILGTTGIVNMIIKLFNGRPQKFFMDNNWFRWVLLISATWKEAGWNTIIYLAAITSINPELYEAAKIDRASRLQQIWYITIPGISSTIVMMLLLRLGSIMEAGFNQVLVMYNPTVYKTGDIINTFIYREGLGKLNWSQGTMVGLFNSLINMILMLGGNYFSRKISGRSIW